MQRYVSAKLYDNEQSFYKKLKTLSSSMELSYNSRDTVVHSLLTQMLLFHCQKKSSAEKIFKWNKIEQEGFMIKVSRTTSRTIIEYVV